MYYGGVFFKKLNLNVVSMLLSSKVHIVHTINMDKSILADVFETTVAQLFIGFEPAQ